MKSILGYNGHTYNHSNLPRNNKLPFRSLNSSYISPLNMHNQLFYRCKLYSRHCHRPYSNLTFYNPTLLDTYCPKILGGHIRICLPIVQLNPLKNRCFSEIRGRYSAHCWLYTSARKMFAGGIEVGRGRASKHELGKGWKGPTRIRA